MARKTKEQKAREDNLNAFFEALETMEKEKGISREYIAEKIAGAIVVSAKKDYGSKDVVFCNIDCEKKIFDVFVKKTVVDEVEDPDTEILLEDALKISKSAAVGEPVEIPLDTHNFGRIAAQTAKHVIRQGIRDAERGQTLQEFQSKNQELSLPLFRRLTHYRQRHRHYRRQRGNSPQSRADTRRGTYRGTAP